jgi:sugar phosphate isomerase/epimerase
MAFCAVIAASVVSQCAAAPAHPATDVYDGWRLGVQAWSFNRFTLFEAVDKARALGLNWIQAYPGQKIAPDIDAGLTFDLSQELRQKVKAKLAEANISMVAYGVVGVPKDEAQARKLFDFAKAMGVEVLASEPSEDQLELIDKLCQEYRIKLAVHNHPKPSHYWNPETVLKALEGRSQWLGACVDVGHWVRSGLDPVECLKKLQGRIHDVHIKEIDIEAGHDVVWGTAQARIKAILEELHRQGYQGTFAIEYEHNWDNNAPLIRQSIAYFNSVASALKPSGWKDVLAPDLSNADFKAGAWVWEDGVLVLKGGSDLWTKATYGDFVLDCEYLLSKKTNSGIFVRAGKREWLPWVEIQVADTAGQSLSKHIGGGIYDIQSPKVNAVLPAGQWNRLTVWAKGPNLKAVLNGQLVWEINLDDWKEAGKNPDGTNNKFTNIAYKDLPRQGFLGFQDHGDGSTVSYRNIKINEL